jgi:FkbM family methyltransferase
MALARYLDGLNRARLWRRRVRVWGSTVRASSLDRLVCLLLHAGGLMGKHDRLLLGELIEPGMHVVDVGANLGLYALLLARLVGPRGRVHAFEPEPTLFQALQSNCRRNGADNVSPVNCALGATAGSVAFYRSLFNSGDNRLGDLSWKGERLEVRLCRLDDVLPDRPIDFVKMDVQGYEFQVLQGATRLLAQGRPSVYFEFWPAGLRAAGTQPLEVLAHLADRGFELFQTEGGRLERVGDFGELERRLPGLRYTNLLARRAA